MQPIPPVKVTRRPAGPRTIAGAWLTVFIMFLIIVSLEHPIVLLLGGIAIVAFVKGPRYVRKWKSKPPRLLPQNQDSGDTQANRISSQHKSGGLEPPKTQVKSAEE